MKKFLIFSVIAMFVATVSAQNEQGSTLLFGQTTNFNFAYSSGNGLKQASLQFGADCGYFVVKNLAITAGLGYKFQRQSYEGYSYDYGSGYYYGNSYYNHTESLLAFTAGLRYYFVKQLFAGVSMMIATDFDKFVTYGGLEVGYDIYISQKVFFEPSINLLKGFSDIDKSAAFGFSFGIGVKL